PRVSVTRRIAQAFCQSRNDCSGSSFEAALIAPERFICPPGDRLASGAARKRALGPERFEPQVTSAAGGGHHTNGPSSPPCGQGSTSLQFLVLVADLHARPALADLPQCLCHKRLSDRPRHRHDECDLDFLPPPAPRYSCGGSYETSRPSSRSA